MPNAEPDRALRRAPRAGRGRWRRRTVAAVVAAVMFVGVPLALMRVGQWRLGSRSPLVGMDPPWRWTRRGVLRWFGTLGRGMRTTDQLVDLFVRGALVVAWICVAVLLVVTVREVVYIVRHGMPSTRASNPLLRLGKWVAVGIVAVLPTVSAPGLLRAAPAMERMAAPVVVVDETAASAHAADGDVHRVLAGESVWSIAEQYAVPGHADSLAAEIVAANLGRVMPDGQRFVTAALVEPGWDVHVPASVHRHVVVAGESYWRIARHELRETLGRTPSERDVKHLADELVERNAPRLGHRQRTLLRPGDVVEIPGSAAGDRTLHIDVPGGEFDISGVEFPPVAVTVTRPPAAAPSPEASTVGPVAAPAVGRPSHAPTTIAATEFTDSPETTVARSDEGAASTTAPFVSAVSTPVVESASVASRSQVAVDDRAPWVWVAGLGALAAAGLLARLEHRRRRAMRAAARRRVLAAPPAVVVAAEQALRACDPREHLARLDLALRVAAPDLADQAACVLGAVLGPRGEVTLLLDAPATPIAAWWKVDVSQPSWTLPTRVDLLDVAEAARRSSAPCPMLVHLGRCAQGELFVDLEAFGGLHVVGLPGLVRSIGIGLAMSPFAEPVEVVRAGIELDVDPDVAPVAVTDDAQQLVATRRARADRLLLDDDTFAARARRRAVEDIDPLAVIVLGEPIPCPPHRGVVVVSCGGDQSAARAQAVVRSDGEQAVFEPLGIHFEPLGVDESQRAELCLAMAHSVPVIVEAVEPEPLPESREWALLVRVLGEPDVVDRNGRRVGFERGKSLELIVWLAHHRRTATRLLARTALWEGEVRDATFANVVSDARRATARLVPPHAGSEWIERTLSERLALHEEVVTDADVLAAAHARWRRGEDPDGSELTRALELVRGAPFSGVAYLWPDGEGVTSAHTILVTAAAADLAEQRLAERDMHGVFWATQQGLRALPGHEELIALRMRAHAALGDLAGVRAEWQSYERSLRVDSWIADEPADKLVELRHSLLGAAMAR